MYEKTAGISRAGGGRAPPRFSPRFRPQTDDFPGILFDLDSHMQPTIIRTSMKFLAFPILAALSWVVAACGPGIDLPKGTRKGYTSARLTHPNPNLPPVADPTQRAIHVMIQNSLRQQFSAKGLAYGTANADLVVAYLVT
jgi:hypothetical protein